MSAEAHLHSLLHTRFQQAFGPPHHDLYDTEQWSLVPSGGQRTVNVLLNGTRMGPLVWVFDPNDTRNAARHFAVTHEGQIDELIERLQGNLAGVDEAADSPRALKTFLDDVLTTEQLASRPSRSPNHAAENDALVALAQGMARDPQTILQLTVDTAMRLCRGESAGISILEPHRPHDGETEIFRWHATAGAFAKHAGGVMPRESPCGTVLDRNALLMFDRPELHYAFGVPVEPPIEEVILAPFHADGKPIGTVWVIAHSSDRRFDREDARLLASVAQFAGAAYQVIAALNFARAGRTRMISARDAAVIHSDELEAILVQRTEELVEAHRKLALSERMATMGTLSAGLGHDMGNMVLAMRLRLQLLQQSAACPNEHIGALGDYVDYIQNLASGLRLMGIDPGNARLGPERIALAAWWKSAHRVLSSGAGPGVFVEGVVPDDLPDVLINRAGLTQAVYNLVHNAAAAMKDTRGCIRIGARLDAPRSPRVLLSVADEGPGMSAEVRRRCLDPFFSTKTSATSSGLGLALVHSVMQAAGGAISIDSALGRGTTFTLKLPVAK